MGLENYGGCSNCTKRKVCSKCMEMCEILAEINDIFCEEVNVVDDIEEKNKKRRKKRGEEDE